jgi:hypothetical protein
LPGPHWRADQRPIAGKSRSRFQKWYRFFRRSPNRLRRARVYRRAPGASRDLSPAAKGQPRPRRLRQCGRSDIHPERCSSLSWACSSNEQGLRSFHLTARATARADRRRNCRRADPGEVMSPSPRLAAGYSLPVSAGILPGTTSGNTPHGVGRSSPRSTPTSSELSKGFRQRGTSR